MAHETTEHGVSVESDQDVDVTAARPAEPAQLARRNAAIRQELRERAELELQATLMHRAANGWREPVYHNGQVCGYRRRYDDRLSMWLLAKWMPERYGPASSDAILAEYDPDDRYD